MIMPLLMLFLCGWVAAQETQFPVEGVYSSIQEFRTGQPLLTKDKLLRNSSSGLDLSIRQWINSEKLLYNDDSGSSKSFDPKKFWGYYENGTLYVFLRNKFHKVTLLGNISYFLESYPKLTGNHSPVVTDARSTSAYKMLDMETGDFLDYDIENLGELLSRDEELSLEYKAIISMKIKRKKMFSFMERYNKKYPFKKLL
jgi:hypothetical protein